MDTNPEIRERILAAAQTLFEQSGRKELPTVDAVRKLSKTSMNDASAVMREWRRSQIVAASAAVVSVPEKVSQASAAALSALWTEAQELANESLNVAQAAWDAERAEAEKLRVLALGLPAVAGSCLGGVNEAIRCFLWAGCVKVTTLHEITRAVNSFGHMFGRKERGAKDESRNNPWLFWLWLGEGLHGFHHRHPLAALMEPVSFDPIGLLILVLERLGIVWDVRRASPTNILGNENVH
jgi:hypothetical protein